MGCTLAILFMAHKKIGRHDLLDEHQGYKKGWYYFLKYHECRTCHSNIKIYADEYETYAFVQATKNVVQRLTLWQRIKNLFPKIKVSLHSREAEYGQTQRAAWQRGDV